MLALAGGAQSSLVAGQVKTRGGKKKVFTFIRLKKLRRYESTEVTV